MTKDKARLAVLRQEERNTQLFLRHAKGLVWELLNVVSKHRKNLDAMQREIAKLEKKVKS